LTLALVAVAFTDELATGVVPAGAPELSQSFALSASAAAGWTLFAFQLLGFVLEPPLLALAHGRRARTFRTIGLALMAAALLAAAAAPTYAVLLAALALYGPGSGLGCGLAQSALASAEPGRCEAALARWNAAGIVGDLLAPAALAASVALGLGWRGALAAVAVLTAFHALALARAPHPEPATVREPEEQEAPLREALRAALAAPGLLGWSLAVGLCGFMDEVLVSFGALWLAERLDAGPAERAAIFVAWELGAIAGSVLLARLARRFTPRALLLAAGLGSLVSHLAWLAAPHWTAGAALAAVSGLFTAAHYPLLKARAFAALPDRPHVVQAVASAFSVLDLALPVLVGLAADRAGLLAAMLLLAVQPVGVIVAAGAARSARTSAPRPAPP
jgi:MFS family permease